MAETLTLKMDPFTGGLTDELNKILAMLKGACPEGAIVSFDFDRRLHVHVDVHSFEDLLKVEGILPILGGGMLHGLTRGETFTIG